MACVAGPRSLRIFNGGACKRRRAAINLRMARSGACQALSCTAIDAWRAAWIEWMRGRHAWRHGRRRRRRHQLLQLLARLQRSLAPTPRQHPFQPLQLKLGDQILAEEKHLPLYKVRGAAGGWGRALQAHGQPACGCLACRASCCLCTGPPCRVDSSFIFRAAGAGGEVYCGVHCGRRDPKLCPRGAVDAAGGLSSHFEAAASP